MDKDDKIICRCEEVLESEIRKAVEEGCRSLKAVKIRTRAGMGSCQGCTCIPLIREIISEMTGIPRSALADPEARFPVYALRLDTLADLKINENE